MIFSADTQFTWSIGTLCMQLLSFFFQYIDIALVKKVLHGGRFTSCKRIGCPLGIHTKSRQFQLHEPLASTKRKKPSRRINVPENLRKIAFVE